MEEMKIAVDNPRPAMIKYPYTPPKGTATPMKDNVIDFSSLKKRPTLKGNSIDNDTAFQEELSDMLSKIPAHMQDFVGRRFTFLMMYSVVTARVAEMLTEEGYEPSDFDPEEESTEAFLANGPFFTEDEDRAPVWNGPMFDAIDDEIFYRVASNIELHGEDEMKINLDLMKREEDGGNWQILVDGEWQPGPPDEYFDYLSMMREDWDEDEEDWEDEEEAPESIYDLVLPNNVISALARNGIETVKDLCDKTPYDLLALKGIGLKSVEMISEELEYLGLGLKRE